MEANNKTVPSIVVYVTVPNKDAGIRILIYFVFVYLNIDLINCYYINLKWLIMTVQLRNWTN